MKLPVRSPHLATAILISGAAAGLIAAPSISVAQSAPAKPAKSSVATIPPAPVPPSATLFSDDAAARRALVLARRNARLSTGFVAKITVVSNESGPLATQITDERFDRAGDPLAPMITGDWPKLALRTQTSVGGKRVIVRLVSETDSALISRFDERGASVVRDVVRANRIDIPRFERLLAVADFRPASRAAQWALSDDFPLTERLWRDSAGAICEHEPEARAGRPRRLRRFSVDPKTGALTRFEEWSVTQGLARGGREAAAKTTYRREDYSLAPKLADAFSDSLPAGYADRKLAIRGAGDDEKRPEMDRDAAVLFEDWSDAYLGFLSVHADAESASRTDKRTEQSRDTNQGFGRFGGRTPTGTYDFWIRRDARARVDFLSGDPRVAPSQSAASDGAIVRISDGGTDRQNRFNDPDRMWRSLSGAARQNAFDPLAEFFNGPPDLADWNRVRSGGTVVLENGERARVLIFERTQTFGQRRGRDLELGVVLWVALGSDNLPRRIETRRDTKIEGALERDQPPVVTNFVRYTNIRVNLEPPAGLFETIGKVVR